MCKTMLSNQNYLMNLFLAETTAKRFDVLTLYNCLWLRRLYEVDMCR